MNYRFNPTEQFWESFYDLTAAQKESTRRAWKIFKQNPFDPRLRAHKIHRFRLITIAQFTPWTLKATSAPCFTSKATAS